MKMLLLLCVLQMQVGLAKTIEVAPATGNEILIVVPQKKTSDLQKIPLSEITVGHVYSHKSSIAGSYGEKDGKPLVQLNGEFYSIALPAKERLPAEEVPGVSFIATFEYFGIKPPVTRDEFSTEARLPWWPLVPGCRLKGFRFGLEGKEKEALFDLVGNGKSAEWKEAADSTLNERVVTLAYGAWGNEMGWRIEADGNYTVLPRVTTDPTKDALWTIADVAPSSGILHEAYNETFHDFTYVVMLQEEGVSRLWRVAPGTSVAKSYFGNKGPEANQMLKLTVINKGWSWSPSTETTYKYIDADRKKDYVFAGNAWQIKDRPVIRVSQPTTYSSSSSDSGRTYDFGPPTGVGGGFSWGSGVSDYVFWLKHQNEYPRFGPPTGMSFRDYYDWNHRNDPGR